MKLSALISIDFQQGFDEARWGTRNNPNAEANMAELMERWRAKEHPIVHIQHSSLEAQSPLKAGQPGHEFKASLQPVGNEKVFSKTVNSAFIGTGLETHLREQNIDTLVFGGLTTDHCVSTTVRMAANLGFKVILVSDATATFDRIGPDGIHYDAETIHRLHLASLHGEFCQVVATHTIGDAKVF